MALGSGCLLLASGCLSTPGKPVTDRISSAPRTNASHQTSNVPQPLQQDVSTQILEMQHHIDELSLLLTTVCARPDTPTQPGVERLQALEKRAQWSDALALELHTANVKIEPLTTELAQQQQLAAELRAKIALLHSRTNELEQSVVDLASKLKPMQDAMQMLRMGNYDYYSVRRGDTCQSIAAQPGIYGDESKHLLIRQANRGQVADLDHLAPDELLIIPRPKGDATHEF